MGRVGLVVARAGIDWAFATIAGFGALSLALTIEVLALTAVVLALARGTQGIIGERMHAIEE